MGDGSRKRLGDICVGDEVVTHLGAERLVEAVHDQGEIETVRITTAAGRVVVAAPDHPFLTPHGWIEAGKLERLDTLACVEPKGIGERRFPLEAYRLAGYFIGDGSTSHNGAMITCFDELEGADIRTCVDALDFGVNHVTKPSLGRRRSSYHINNGVRRWLALWGLAGKTSHTKTVPEQVMTGDREAIAHFLGAYFACDGHVNRVDSKRNDACAEFYSVSPVLLEQTQHLLLRPGIPSSLSRKNGLYNRERHVSYRLSITSRDAVCRFFEQVPIFSVKAQEATRWHMRKNRWRGEFIPDTVVSVEPNGLRPCRCLSVAEDHTFTANDLVVHNTLLASVWGSAWVLGLHPDLARDFR